jgi:hypothetical protein
MAYSASHFNQNGWRPRYLGGEIVRAQDRGQGVVFAACGRGLAWLVNYVKRRRDRQDADLAVEMGKKIALLFRVLQGWELG